ncbi:hypothetical protein ZIOFF_046655 [Zingiber officinale]|uniref:DNA-directed RNA polymerase n=1 Tax=Zingiber officinale TaxID=94328 RepID=A0A8J5KW14_ZINOF|nr:hypothetical protein ZIOFF_046655 [Zingiber officinale]
MSSNTQHQAVPLSQSERCIVGAGLERQTTLDSGVSAIAEHEGKIIYTDPHKIIFASNGDTTISIPLVICQRSNENTCMHQKPQVSRGKCIKKGQILADGAATVGGNSLSEKNVLVAYMPWEGYNFEDAVLISERLVYEDIYTSFHIRKYEIQTHTTSQGPERFTREISHLEAHLLRNLDRNGVVMLGSWVETDRTPVDMVFNPLGLPSRKNMGQIFECSLGLARDLLKRHYRIASFDERYKQEASRKLVFSELYEAKMLTYKSDDIRARQEVLGAMIIGGRVSNLEDAPESFRLLVRELQSLAIELNHFLVSEKNFQINRKEA